MLYKNGVLYVDFVRIDCHLSSDISIGLKSGDNAGHFITNHVGKKTKKQSVVFAEWQIGIFFGKIGIFLSKFFIGNFGSCCVLASLQLTNPCQGRTQPVKPKQISFTITHINKSFLIDRSYPEMLEHPSP